MNDKKSSIFQATINLLGSEGVGVSTARIAKAAGVSNGTLFNYFPTKQELLDALFLEIKAELAEIVHVNDASGTLEVIVRQYWSRYFDWATKNRAKNAAMILLLESQLISNEARRKAETSFAANHELMRQGIEAGIIINMPPNYISDLFITQINLAISSELSKEESERACDVFWRGIKT